MPAARRTKVRFRDGSLRVALRQALDAASYAVVHLERKRKRGDNGPWRQLPHPACFSGRVASISADDDEMIALDTAAPPSAMPTKGAGTTAAGCCAAGSLGELACPANLREGRDN